jgi:hypothetical protein
MTSADLGLLDRNIDDLIETSTRDLDKIKIEDLK